MNLQIHLAHGTPPGIRRAVLSAIYGVNVDERAEQIGHALLRAREATKEAPRGLRSCTKEIARMGLITEDQYLHCKDRQALVGEVKDSHPAAAAVLSYATQGLGEVKDYSSPIASEDGYGFTSDSATIAALTAGIPSWKKIRPELRARIKALYWTPAPQPARQDSAGPRGRRSSRGAVRPAKPGEIQRR